MRAIRALLLLAGLGMGGYGLSLYLDTGWTNVRDSAFWLVGGVLVHDGLLAPLTLLVAAGALAVARPPRAVAVGFVLATTVTIVGIPVLGRFGERADNPSLLNRNYLAGWLVLMGLIALGTAVAVLRSRRPREAAPPEATKVG